MTEHTPLPWRFDVFKTRVEEAVLFADDLEIGLLYASNGADEPTMIPAVANAAYIVKACNAYPELVKALTGASHALRSYQYGNASTELAQGQADHIDALLKRISTKPPAPTSDDRSVGRADSEIA